jgi:hypothetical protein
MSKKQLITIAEMASKNSMMGQHWFSKGAMEFFNTKIETQPNQDNIFITSEYMDNPSDKKYSLRQFDAESWKVDTLGDFREFDTIADARKARSNYKGDK